MRGFKSGESFFTYDDNGVRCQTYTVARGKPVAVEDRETFRAMEPPNKAGRPRKDKLYEDVAKFYSREWRTARVPIVELVANQFNMTKDESRNVIGRARKYGYLSCYGPGRPGGTYIGDIHEG